MLRNRLAGILPCDGTYDVECAEWDRFLVAATYEPSCGTTLHRSADAMLDHILRRGGTWWAHAGGVYDGVLVAELLRRRGLAVQIDYPRSRITRMVSGGATFRDSFSLMPFGLETVAALAGEPCPALPWQCICGEDCGGYCQITMRAAGGDPDLDDYVGRDAYVLYRGLDALAHFCVKHRIALKGTIGSTAWATARERMELPDAEFPLPLRNRIASADKGGRDALVRPRATGPGSHDDISSAYPAALARCELPVGAMACLSGPSARAALLRGTGGVYACHVTVPDDSFYPPLPWRCGGRIVYPTGSFHGVWPLPELLAAIERGAHIDRVTWAICWEATGIMFGDWVNEMYAIRRSSGKRTPAGQWMRELLNSLTGKFGERPERRTVRMHPEEIKVCMREKSCRDGCRGTCGAFVQLDRWGQIWGQPFYRPSASGHLQWSAYLKAHTRIQWLEAAEQLGEEVCYGATDSLWHTSRKRPQPAGTMLGAWEHKHTWTNFEAVAVRCYRFTDEHGDAVIRAAGAARLTDAEWLAGRSERGRGVLSLLEAAQGREGLFKRRNRRWTLPGQGKERVWYGDRKLTSGEKLTYPASAHEHRHKAVQEPTF